VEDASHLAELALVDARTEDDAVQSKAERVLARRHNSKEFRIAMCTLKEEHSY
jgi:hypothetical protein